MEKMKQIKISEFNHTLLKTIAASEGRQIQDVVEDILSKAVNVDYVGNTGKKEEYKNNLKQRSRIKELMELRKERESKNG